MRRGDLWRTGRVAAWVLCGVLVSVLAPTSARAQDDAPGASCGMSETPLSPAEIMALKDDAFIDAVTSLVYATTAERPPVRELGPLLARCDGLAPKSDIPGPCEHLADLIASHAAPDDEQWLWQLHDNLKSESLQRQLIERMLDLYLVRNLASVPTRATAPDLHFDGQVPERFSAAPLELVEAWKLEEALRGVLEQRPRADLPKAQRGAEAAEAATADLYALIPEYLRGQKTAAEAIAAVDRADAASSFPAQGPPREIRSKLLVAALVEEKQYLLAAGAALELLDPFIAPSETDTIFRHATALAGLDPTTIAAGAVLAGHPSALGALAASGTDRAVRLLLDVHDVPANDEGVRFGSWNLYLWTVGGLLAPSGECEPDPFFAFQQMPEPLPTALEEEILNLLAQHVSPSASLEEAGAASANLLNICRRESLPAFKTMLRSPYSRVRERGVQALRALGEEVADVPESKPVTIRVLVDGEPLLNTDVMVHLPSQGGFGAGMGGATDGQGRLTIQRDLLLDVQYPVQRIVVEPLATKPGDLWFSVAVPRPADLDAVTDISVATSTITLAFTPIEGAPPPKSVSLAASQWFSEKDRMWPVLDADDVGSEPLTFPHLQRSSYELLVTTDAGRWQSETIKLDESPVTVVFPDDFHRLPPDEPAGE